MLSLTYLDLTGTRNTGNQYKLVPSVDPQLYAQVLENPDMNLTFQGRYDVQPDHFLACHFNGVFVGGIILHNQPSRHIALHLAIDRVNYKDTIHYFAELAVLYALQLGRLPITMVPNGLRAMKFWMSHVIGIRQAHKTTSVVRAGETVENVCLYILPNDWAPRYVNNVVFNWR